MRLISPAIKSGDCAPVPSVRERRDDAQALFALGSGWRRGLQGGHLACGVTDLLARARSSRARRRIAILTARRAIGHEARAVVNRVDRHRPGQECPRRSHPAGTSLVTTEFGADLRTRPDLDGTEDLRARPDDDAVADGRMALSADPG